jgi:XisI protein
VWIEYNGTDARLGEELVAAGIPRNDIVLAFQPVELRSLAGFGANN